MNHITTFDEHLDNVYGKLGDELRTEFEINAKSFVIGEMIKNARLEANLTQDQLAEKTGTKKSYISRIENGRSDIQLSTLFRIVELGFNKKINLFIS